MSNVHTIFGLGANCSGLLEKCRIWVTVGSKIRSGCQKNGWVANVAISGCLLYLSVSLSLMCFYYQPKKVVTTLLQRRAYKSYSAVGRNTDYSQNFCQLFTILPVHVFRNVPVSRGRLIVKRILFTTVTIHSVVTVCPLHSKYAKFEISRD